MTEIVVVDREGKERNIDAENGISLMHTLRDNGFDELVAICGGSGACGTCHVYIEDTERAGQRSFDEEQLLELSQHLRPVSRLSCQIEITDALEGLRVTIAPEE